MRYEDYFSDFATRCFDVLKASKGQIKNKKRDVTARLCVMSAALTVPHERLQPVSVVRNATHAMHPAGDSIHYAAAARLYATTLSNDDFTQTLGVDGLWHMGTFVVAWADDWLRHFPQHPTTMPANTKVGGVLTVMRNALAHGSVVAFPKVDKTIKSVAFLSVKNGRDVPRKPNGHQQSNRVEFKFVHTSVKDLGLFMDKWRKFLTALGAAR